MGRTAETKKKILKMLKKNNRRLMDIYPELGLTAATVSQHLKELKEMGLIEELDNSHFKNEKYYSIKRGDAENVLDVNRPWKRDLTRIGAASMAIAIGAIIILFFAHVGNVAGGKYIAVNVLLTDPPHVPLGTKNLYINYTSIRLHVANSTKWISVNSSGSVDLMSLINVSKIIGLAKIPEGTNIDEVSFAIQNGYIYIGNSTYPLYITSNQITGTVAGVKSVNSTEDILVDFSPAVLALYNNNTVSFEMIPSLSAEVINRQQLIPKGYGGGTVFGIAGWTASQFWQGLNITSASIVSNGNLTKIKVVVEDSSNRSIDISHIQIFGNEPMYLNQKALGNMSRNRTMAMIRQNGDFENAYNWTSGMANSSWPFYLGRESGNRTGSAGWVTVRGFFNMPRSIDANTMGHIEEAGALSLAYRMSAMKNRLGVIDFIANKNETLTEPFLPIYPGTAGYVVSPGQSATLEFNGTVTVGRAGLMIINFTPGNSYVLEIVGNGCEYADTNVIAG